MRVLVTGGAGYVGHVLVPRLLLGHLVTVYDTLWYGCRLPNHARLRVIKGDIRDVQNLGAAMRDHDMVIHLACISNDSSFELDENLSKSINFDAFGPMVEAAKRAKIKRFVYCSTSSVYGVSDEPEVTEEHPLVPLTLYNRYKAACEPVLLESLDKDFTGVILRPATLCGYSPRMRLDLAINALTIGALSTGVIKVFGGAQHRPNLHIKDMVDVYLSALRWPTEKIQGQIFNVSQENRSILSLAQQVKREIGACEIDVQESSDDQRSYRVNADKIRRVLGYRPHRFVGHAIQDVLHACRNYLLPNNLTDDIYYNVRRMKALGVK